MKGKYKYLLRMQLYNLFGINRLIHSHNKQEKQRSAIVAALGLVAIAVFAIYITEFSNSMAEAGLSKALPTLIVVACSLATLTLTFVKSTGVLIGIKDFDMVMSLPVNTISIVTSRITLLYLINLIVGFIAMLPSSVIYIVYEHPPISCYLFLVGALFLTPIIPMIISLSLGVLIVAVSSRSRHKNIFSLVLSTFVLLIIVFASARTQSMDATQITNLGAAMAEAANKFYPPAILLTNALLNNDWAGFAIFAAVSMLSGIAFVTIVSHYYKALNTAVFSHYAKKDYKLETLKASSPFMALYKKELCRLSSCTIYALNSCIGIVLLFVMSVAAVFFMPSALRQQVEMMGIMSTIQNIMPIALSIFVSMTSTTAASLSLEGKSRWIMCSAPTQARIIYNSKIAVNLTVILPVLYVSGIFIRIAIPCSLLQTILMFVIPTVYAFFISVLGMYLNIKFPKYDWTSEYYAVKGGAVSVLATIGGGISSSFIPLYLCIMFPQYQMIIIPSITCLILLVTLAIYHKVCQTQLYV
ncbi:MAG: hypothetical protein HFH62_09670 [Lachnospiraceae bacterium]|nr:hypothetical protein [Lachnospiraceae bacterium]